MRRWTKVIKGMTAVLAAVVVAAGGMKMPVKAADPGNVEITTVPDNKTYTFAYQQAKDIVLNVKNTGRNEITEFRIEPDLRGDDSSQWPFKTDYQKYSATIKKLEPGKNEQVKFNFTERDDIETARYSLYFTYEFTEGADQKSGQTTVYVNTTQKPEAKVDSKDTSGKSDGASDYAGQTVRKPSLI